MSAMTEQEVFDRVVEHMAKQRGPAVDDDTLACAYRTEDGRSCAIGCLLTDAEAAPLGTESVREIELTGLLPERLRGVELSFLVDLQYAHDVPSDSEGAAYLLHWRKEMAETAADYKLSTAKLDELCPEVSP